VPTEPLNSRPDLANALSILDALDALVYVADMDTYEILFANRRACKDLGQDIIGRTCWKTIQAGQDGPCPFCTNHLLRDAAGNPAGPHTWEFRNTKNGRWYHIVDQAMTWSDGRLVRLEIATDITRRKLAESELKAKNELLNSIFRNAPYAMLLVNREGRVMDANRAAENQAGRPHQELLGLLGGEVLRCLNSARPEGCGRTTACDSCPVRNRIDQTYATGEGVYNAEASLDVLQGDKTSTIHFLMSTEPVHLAGEDLVLVSLADITKRKQAEEALWESEARFRSVVEATPLGIHLYELTPDATLVFTGANPAADNILGIRHADLVGLPIEEAFPAHRDTDLPSIYRRVAAHGDRFVAAEYTYLDERFFGDYDLWAFQTSPGCMAVIFMDVSERKRASDELLKAKLAAEEANQAKSEFLATMSHEIRTPLNGVMGMLQLAAGESLPPEVQGWLDTALHSSRNLLRVLSDILDLSRIEAGAMPISAEPFPVESELLPVVEAFRPEAMAKGLGLELVADPNVPERLVGDAGRIRQVLFNLVANAVKYTEAGHIRVEAYPLHRFSKPGAVALHLAVVDTGLGIADEQLRRAFEPFSQVDGSSTRRHGGAGLGLAIVRRLVSLMGGTLSYCSEPGKGTEAHLTLFLPLAEPQPEPAASIPDEPSLAPHIADARVLVVEDEPVNRLAVTRMLQKLGMIPAAAANGPAALELLASQHFDCVLMDIQMPEMDGVETTRRIRDAKAGAWDPHIPVLALTAHAMKGDRERFLAAGLDGYIAKPVDMEDLRQAIGNALTRR
jgi:PAS domain S-box-containing protein